MNTITHWNPFREMEALQSRVLRALHPTSNTSAADARNVTDWTPVVDISEDDTEYLIHAELPDVPRENVTINVENGQLTFSGKRTFEEESKDRKYHRVERAYGSFTRTFSLPDDTDVERIHAEYKEGMLNIHLPKSESARPRRIEVAVK
jgi:HSP20 family protein